jgi:hypothetical protein
MHLIQELMTLREGANTFTYRLTYDGNASLFNHPHDIDEDKLNAGQESFEHEELKALENRMRENVMAPETQCDTNVVDFKLERVEISVAQLLHDIEQDAGIYGDDLGVDDVVDIEDEKERQAMKDKWTKAREKSIEKEKGDKPFTWAVEYGRSPTCPYRIEAILIVDKKLTNQSAKIFADEMGGTIWGQYWDDGGDALPEYKEITRPVPDSPKPAKKPIVDKNAEREAWKKRVLEKYPDAWFTNVNGLLMMAYRGKEGQHGVGEQLVGSFTRQGKNGSFVV